VRTDLTSLNPTASKLAISGWGSTQDPGLDNCQGPCALQVVSLNYYSNRCPWQPQRSLGPSEICAARPSGTKSSCRGDSGGPAVWLDPNSQKVKLMGVVSYGPVPCGEAGIFASVPHVVDWINAITGDCNSITCGQNMCITKEKLMPQALQMLGGGLS